MDGDALDEDTLGRQVDAWLVTLRAQGLSARRIWELAGLLGQAMSARGPQNAAEAHALQRFEAWKHTAFNQRPPA